MAILNEYGWPANTSQLREMLGLSPHRHLPVDGLPTRRLQGYQIKVYSARAIRVAAWAGFCSKNKPHRIYVQCKRCWKWFPAGRLTHHERACDRQFEQLIAKQTRRPA